MVKLEMCEVEGGGFLIAFETSTTKCTAWLSRPPHLIEHIDKTYLQKKLKNVTREEHVKFIKKRLKEEIKRLTAE